MEKRKKLDCFLIKNLANKELDCRTLEQNKKIKGFISFSINFKGIFIEKSFLFDSER